MKIKLFNGQCDVVDLAILGGGYDSTIGRIHLVVQSDDKALTGSILIDPTEAVKLMAYLSTAPKVERVEASPTKADALAQR